MANATILVSLDGSAYTRGGVPTLLNQAVQLHAQTKEGWKTAKWECIAPKSFTTPLGWTTLGDGFFHYLGTTEDPPPFVADVWGKYFLRLTVNDGVTLTDETLVDETTMLSIKSPNNFEDIGVFETSQFDIVRFWVGPLQDIVRAVDAFVTGGGVAFGGDLDPARSSSTAQYVRSLSGVAGSVAIAATGAVLKWVAATVLPGRAHARSTTGPGSAMQDRTQAAQSGSGAPAGDFRVILGKSDGAGTRPFWRLAYETVAESTYVDALAMQWDGVRALVSSLGAGVALRLGTSSNGDVELAPHGTGSVAFLGRLRLKTRTVTASATIADDAIVYADTTAGAVSLTMPTPTDGRTILVKALTPLETNALTLVRAGSEKIAGVAANLTLTANGGAWIITSNGIDWFLFRC